MLFGRAFLSYATLRDDWQVSTSWRWSSCWLSTPSGGGIPHPAAAPHINHWAASGSHGGGRWGIAAPVVGTALIPPPPPLHKWQQPARNDWSSSKASKRLCIRIYIGWFPFQRSSHTARRSISPPSSSATSTSPEAFSLSVGRNVWTYWQGPWHPPAQLSSPCVWCAGLKSWSSDLQPRWDVHPRGTRGRSYWHPSTFPGQRGEYNTQQHKKWTAPIIKCKEIMLAPQIFVSSMLNLWLTLKSMNRLTTNYETVYPSNG